jgi:hypothetical protein
MKLRVACVVVGLLSFVVSLAAQTSSSSSATAQVPPLIQFSNVATDVNGKPPTGVIGITFSLYQEQQGGPPLWLETQNVQPDKTGHYTVLLGSTTSQGLPTSIFAAGEARWLGVQVSGQEEQPRVLLVSAPYALKAGDAETIGGLPPSAFMLAAPASANTANNGSNADAGSGVNATAVVSGSGTTDFIPLWTNSTVVGNSVLFQSGSGNTATVGINTITPAATLDVNGGVISRGALQLPSTGTATAGAGFDSQPFSLQGSAFNSGTGKAIGPVFQWQTEPSGNNTSSPAGTLNLLYGRGSGSPSETGLNIASNGQITFATGQAFPGAGTITGVTAGTGLTGGGNSGSITLSLASNACASGSALSALPFTCSPFAILGANTFTANQTVNGTLTANTSNTFGVIGTTSSTATFAAGVEGVATAPTGTTIGVYGNSQSSAGIGVYAEEFSQTGNTYGVYAQTESPAGYGVYGFVDSDSGTTAGVWGNTSSTTGYGVMGTTNEPTGTTTGVFGQSKSPVGLGVLGSNIATTGTAVGVNGTTASAAGYGVEGISPYIGVYGTGSTGMVGTSSSASGTGVQGSATSTSGNNFGVFGITNSPSGYGVYGENFVTSGTTAGVYGTTASTQGYGVEGVAAGSGGAAGFFQVNQTSATILQGNNNTTTEFKVDSAGDVIAAGAISAGSSFQIGGQLFAYGNSAFANAFLGFAGSPTSNATAQYDTAVGVLSLSEDSTGANTAVGFEVLVQNTTGLGNTAIGFEAGETRDASFVTGSYNTVLGANAGFSTGTLNNATAIGANAVVSESNALVLGSGANVGIGTSTPGHLLDVAGGIVAFDSTGLNNGTTIDLTFGVDSGEGMSSSRTAGPNQYGLDLYTDYNRRISIEQHGNVGIGTTSPDNLLTVNGSADKPGGGSWGTFSDARLKTVNGGFTDGLSQVMKIQPIHYRYKPGNAMGIRDTDEHIGVVAQDVQKVIPEAVTENSKGYLLVNNDPIIWTMLNAIKEQQGEVQHEQAASKDQQAELTKALRLIKQQQSLLRAQSAAMQSLKAEVRETRESLRKVKAQVAAAQPRLVAAK